jgi:serine/threonine-protein kinase
MAEPSEGEAAPTALPARIAGYAVRGELGRGGMARVYHVVDERSGRELALKQLCLTTEHKPELAPMFEREFHTLAQLRHPSVIEVYDYGIAQDGPYYTMQLLDGGDLRGQSPLPWRQACELLFDVCSSLALLHSRRLVHRDVTPRNVRCTRSGSAKLIDFGAMVPMGRAAQVVGTPGFIAPEVLQRGAIDGRTDLYSLGATFYFVLTGKVPFSARRLSDMITAWRAPPPAPSLLCADVSAVICCRRAMRMASPADRDRANHAMWSKRKKAPP